MVYVYTTLAYVVYSKQWELVMQQSKKNYSQIRILKYVAISDSQTPKPM